MTYAFSRGRTALLLSLLGILLIALHNNKRARKWILNVAPLIYFLCVFLIALLIFIYSRLGHNAKIVRILNDAIFNGRIGLSYTTLILNRITLFGKNLDLSAINEDQYYALDNGQIMILVVYGIIGSMTYFFIIQQALIYIKQQQEYVFAVVMIMFIIWSMYEGTMYFVGKNFALLFLGTMSLEERPGKAEAVDGQYINRKFVKEKSN